jgi:hypothetical protein
MGGESTPEGRIALAIMEFLKRDRRCHTCGDIVQVSNLGNPCAKCGNISFLPGLHDWEEYLLPYILFESLGIQQKEAHEAMMRSPAEQVSHVMKLRKAFESIANKVRK